MFWIAARDRIFAWLEQRAVPYDGTSSAVLHIVSRIQSEEARAAIVYIYTVGVMAEWDESITISATDASEYRAAADRLISIIADSGINR